MKVKSYLHISVLLITILFFLTFSFVPSSYGQQPEKLANITIFEGDAFVKSKVAEPKGEWAKLKKTPHILYNGDEVKTEKGTVEIEFLDGSIVKMAEKYVDAIGIHPRTVDQGYSGKPDYKFALKLKKAVNVPVIYSGNVNEDNAKNILRDFDFVFIGRAAIGNPGIFGKKYGFVDYLKLAKKYGLFFRQVKFQAMNFTKGISRAKKIRLGLVGAKSVSGVEKVMKTNI